MQFPDWLNVAGDPSYRGECPSETMEQITLVNRLRREYPDTLGRLVIHVKNEGKRTARQADMDKAQGMTPGASDILIVCSPAIVIELKRRDHTKSKWQPGQIDYLEAAHKQGSFACVALGADAAMEFIRECLKTMKSGSQTK